MSSKKSWIIIDPFNQTSMGPFSSSEITLMKEMNVIRVDQVIVKVRSNLVKIISISIIVVISLLLILVFFKKKPQNIPLAMSIKYSKNTFYIYHNSSISFPFKLVGKNAQTQFHFSGVIQEDINPLKIHSWIYDKGVSLNAGKYRVSIKKENMVMKVDLTIPREKLQYNEIKQRLASYQMLLAQIKEMYLKEENLEIFEKKYTLYLGPFLTELGSALPDKYSQLHQLQLREIGKKIGSGVIMLMNSQRATDKIKVWETIFRPVIDLLMTRVNSYQ